MPQDLSARLATTIVIEMMGDTNIDDALARSQLTLQATCCKEKREVRSPMPSFREAIG